MSCYAMSGTDRATTRCALSGTGVAYCATKRYGMSGSDLGRTVVPDMMRFTEGLVKIAVPNFVVWYAPMRTVVPALVLTQAYGPTRICILTTGCEPTSWYLSLY
eukprot:866244-Rhodomonas_salina.1